MADDLGVLYTDRKLSALEKKIAKEYKQAQKDIEKKTREFFNKAQKKDHVMQSRLKAGKITQEEYDHWKQGKIFYGENWKAQQESIAKVLADTNKVATAMINGEKADVFAFNGNYTGYQLEHGFGVNFGFDLYSEKSVERLLRDNPKLLPPKKLDPAKDNPWNMRNIRSQVTQGLIQGESIPKIAKRLSEVVPNRNEKQMVLHARTAMTSAQNGGRQERFKEAEKLGIKFKKVWIATFDNRTRDSHRDLDGQAVKPDEPFRWGDEFINFPGDPGADPALVYNCRCTLGTELDDYPRTFTRRVQEDGSIIADQSYREWEASKQNAGQVQQVITPQTATPAQPAPELLRELSKVKATMSEDDYNTFYGMVQGNEYVEWLYDGYEDTIPVQQDGGGFYNKYSGVHYGMEKEDKFSTVSHEYAHAFDDRARAEFDVTYNEVDRLNKAVSDGWGIKYEPFKRTPSQCDEYLEAIRKDKEILREAIKQKMTRDELNGDDFSAGVQDLCDGLFGTQDSREYHLKWGHGNKYYNRKYNNNVKGYAETQIKDAFKELGFDASNQAKVKNLTRLYETSSELWANQAAALTTRSGALDYMEYYCPNSMAVIKRLLKERK